MVVRPRDHFPVTCCVAWGWPLGCSVSPTLGALHLSSPAVQQIPSPPPTQWLVFLLS